MMDAASVFAGIIIGGGLGSIAGVLNGRKHVAELTAKLALRKSINRIDTGTIVGLQNQLAAMQAKEDRRMAPLKAANEARHAARIAREAEARAVREATHSGMRAKLAELI